MQNNSLQSNKILIAKVTKKQQNNSQKSSKPLLTNNHFSTFRAI